METSSIEIFWKAPFTFRGGRASGLYTDYGLVNEVYTHLVDAKSTSLSQKSGRLDVLFRASSGAHTFPPIVLGEITPPLRINVEAFRDHEEMPESLELALVNHVFHIVRLPFDLVLPAISGEKILTLCADDLPTGDGEADHADPLQESALWDSCLRESLDSASSSASFFEPRDEPQEVQGEPISRSCLVFYLPTVSRAELLERAGADNLAFRNFLPRDFSRRDLLLALSFAQHDADKTESREASSILRGVSREQFIEDLYPLRSCSYSEMEVINAVQDGVSDEKIRRGLASSEQITISGPAGTGKTTRLLQIAADVLSRVNVTRYPHVAVLTYNHTLRLNLKRIFRAMGWNVDSDEETDVRGEIHFGTLDHFFRQVFVALGLLGNAEQLFPPNDHGKKYERLLKLAWQHLDPQYDKMTSLPDGSMPRPDDDRRKVAKCLPFTFVCIDEAQDLRPQEQKILNTVFYHGSIAAAHSKLQLSRTTKPAKWPFPQGIKHEEVELKLSLRMPGRIADLVNRLAEKYRLDEFVTTIDRSHDDLSRCRILNGPLERFPNAMSDVLLPAHRSGIAPYYYDFLVVSTNKEMALDLQQTGLFPSGVIDYWNIVERTEENNAIYDSSDYLKRPRVVSYQSSRGLEGFTVVLDRADHFFLDYAKDHGEKQAIKWLLIAMSRCLKHLVITIENPRSTFAKILHGALETPSKLKYEQFPRDTEKES